MSLFFCFDELSGKYNVINLQEISNMFKFEYILAASAVFLAADAHALLYSAGRVGATEDEKNLKWSDCKWYSNMDFETKANPGKPGPSDIVGVRFGGYSLLIDSDVNAASFMVTDNSKATAEGRNIKLKRDLRISIGMSQNSHTKAIFKGCNIDLGGAVTLAFWDQARAAGLATLDLENTKLTARGDLVVTIPANGRFTNKTRAGFIMALAGKSQVFFGGGALIDSIITELPKEWMVAFKFSAKEGSAPTLIFAKNANLNGCTFEIECDGSLKPGKYTLLELQNPKSVISPYALSFNGKPYTFGDTVSAGGKTLKAYLGAAGKDAKTANDIILEVLK